MEDDELDSLMDDFLEQRGHEVSREDWITDQNKYQCPDCGGIHQDKKSKCNVCGWQYTSN